MITRRSAVAPEFEWVEAADVDSTAPALEADVGCTAVALEAGAFEFVAENGSADPRSSR